MAPHARAPQQCARIVVEADPPAPRGAATTSRSTARCATSRAPGAPTWKVPAAVISAGEEVS
jgi:hypothetical protein